MNTNSLNDVQTLQALLQETLEQDEEANIPTRKMTRASFPALVQSELSAGDPTRSMPVPKDRWPGVGIILALTVGFLSWGAVLWKLAHWLNH